MIRRIFFSPKEGGGGGPYLRAMTGRHGISHPIAIALLAMLGILLFGATTLSAQRTVRMARVTLVDSQEVSGRVLVDTPDSLVIVTNDDERVAVPREQVQTAYFYRYRGRYLTEQYWSFGLTYGDPGLLNVVVARNVAHEWQFRTSFGYLGDRFGLEFGGLYRFADTGPFGHSILFGAGHAFREESSIVGGAATFVGQEWTYFHIGYNLRVVGLDLNASFSSGSGDYENPRFLYQVGYVHAFE